MLSLKAKAVTAKENKKQSGAVEKSVEFTDTECDTTCTDAVLHLHGFLSLSLSPLPTLFMFYSFNQGGFNVAFLQDTSESSPVQPIAFKGLIIS